MIYIAYIRFLHKKNSVRKYEKSVRKCKKSVRKCKKSVRKYRKSVRKQMISVRLFKEQAKNLYFAMD